MREASRIVILPVETASKNSIPPSIDVAMDYASSSLPKLVRLASKIQREGHDQVERIQGMVKPAMPEGQTQNRLATNYSIATYFAGLVRTCQ